MLRTLLSGVVPDVACTVVNPQIYRDLRFKRLHRKPPRLQLEGVPRAEVTVPISPTGALSDGVVYEDAANPASLMHLPRFRIRTTPTSYDQKIEPTPTGRWSVRFGVEPYPAEELGDHVRTPALAFTLPAAALSYEAPPLSRRLEATEILPDAQGYTIGFDVDLPGKDEVLWALSSEAGIRLSLSRAFTAAVPVASVAAEPTGAVVMTATGIQLLKMIQVLPTEPLPQTDPLHDPDPTVVSHVVRDFSILRDPSVVRDASVVSDMGIARHIGLLRGAAPAEGLRVVRDHRTRAGEIAADEAIPARRIRRMDAFDRFKDLTFDPGRVIVTEPVGIPAPETRYRVTPTVLVHDCLLRLLPASHPDIFQGVDAQAPTFRTVRVSHPAVGPTSRSHVYFQDERRPEVFVYLPDEFVLARTESAPIRPALVFRVAQGGSEAETRTSMTLRLRPRTDPTRLEAAAVELGRLIPPPLTGQPAAQPVLEPLQADATLNLNLPPDAVLEAPPLDLINGFMAEVDFGFAQFQDVFAALASADELGTLLRGTVEVEVGTDDGARSSGRAFVPVDIRFGSAGGDVLTVDESVGTGGGVALTVRNSSESPVRIDALPLRMTRGDSATVPAAAAVTFPVDLAASAELSFEVTPSAPLDGDGEVDVLVDLSRVVPLPDAEAILALTLDERIAQTGARTVTVLTTAHKLAGGGDPVRDIFVEFEGGLGPPAHVSADQMQTTASVPVPLVDVLLRRDSGPYRFRQTILRDSGDQRDTDWRSTDASALIVPLA